MSDLLILRADAGPGIGSGHAMRMIALGEAWTNVDRDAVMLASSLPGWLEKQAGHRGVHVERIDAARGSQDDAMVSKAAAADAEWVVLDGYEFGPDFQHQFDPDRLLIVDDHLSLGGYRAAWVLDQNLGAENLLADYRGAAPGAGLLLGSRYALLRREFAAVERSSTLDQARRVLVTLGGAPPVEARALLDAAMEQLQSSGFAVDELSGATMTLHPGWLVRISPSLLPGRRPGSCARPRPRASSCHCVEPGSSREGAARCRRGPRARLVRRPGTDDLVDAVRRLAGDRDRREQMGDRARVVIGGVGAERGVRILRGSRVRLREAKPDDAALLWRWATMPRHERSPSPPIRFPGRRIVGATPFRSRLGDLRSGRPRGRLRRAGTVRHGGYAL